MTDKAKRSSLGLEVKGSKVSFTIDGSHIGELSQSGKSMVIYNSGKSVPIPGTDLHFTLSVYRYAS